MLVSQRYTCGGVGGGAEPPPPGTFLFVLHRYLLSLWRSAVAVADRGKIKDADLCEVDETYLGKRKYNRGKRSRKSGLVCVQTILGVKKTEGKRKGNTLKARIVPDRTKETLLKNISGSVKKGIPVQSDGLRSYGSLPSRGYPHDWVNHKERFVAVSRGKKVHTNTIESAHSQIKRVGRKVHIFYGQCAAGLKAKLDELVFRYNNRGKSDLFLIVLCFLLLKFPCCGKNYVAQQIRSVLSL